MVNNSNKPCKIHLYCMTTVSINSCKILPLHRLRHVAKETRVCMNDITWFRQVKLEPCDILRHPFEEKFTEKDTCKHLHPHYNLTLDIESPPRLTDTLCH